MEIKTPYLLFLGDVPTGFYAKTGYGLAHWRAEDCLAQMRLPDCAADLGITNMTPGEAAEAGAKSFVIAVAPIGGIFPDAWASVVIDAMESGLDIVSPLHDKISERDDIQAAATRLGRTIHEIRHSKEKFSAGTGKPRSGKRLLTVGSDCALGKKYAALAIAKEMQERGMNADFRATGQTGVLISGRGVAIDSVVADFISGAAEWLSPANDADHWDIIEGQGAITHPAYAGVTLGLLHGSAPDALILCHDPTRTHHGGWEHKKIPPLEDVMALYLANARATSETAKFVGIALKTDKMTEAEALAEIERTEAAFGMPCVDPIRTGVGPVVDILEKM